MYILIGIDLLVGERFRYKIAGIFRGTVSSLRHTCMYLYLYPMCMEGDSIILGHGVLSLPPVTQDISQAPDRVHALKLVAEGETACS